MPESANTVSPNAPTAHPATCSTGADAAPDVFALAAEVHRLKATLAAAQTRADNLEIALHTSRRIGAAIGITMAEYSLTIDAAFALVQAVSQHSNRKVREIAEDVIYTGTLDLHPAAWSPGRTTSDQRPDLRIVN